MNDVGKATFNVVGLKKVFTKKESIHKTLSFVQFIPKCFSNCFPFFRFFPSPLVPAAIILFDQLRGFCASLDTITIGSLWCI